ncbi:unnamed protein product, partial [Oppiella nova]
SETRPIIAGITGDTVYHLFRSNDYEIIETKCKTFDEFYANELQMTVTAIEVNGCQRNIPTDTANGYYNNTFDVLDELGQGNPNDVQNIMNETKHLIRIRSEFVIQYYYSWVENNCLYFQMELCFGNLAKVLQMRRNPFGGHNKVGMTTRFECYIAVHMFRELLECVQYLHENHIIHRDLKPDNVLIAMNGTETERYVKLCDFGLSKEVFSTGGPHPMSAVTHTQDVGGAQYQAPEAMGANYNHKIDIYSLALIGIDIFEFNRKCFMNGKDQLYTAYDTDLADLMTSIYGILLEMSANEYSKRGSTDWRARPECSDILLRFNRLSVGAVIKENDVKLFDECIESKCQYFYHKYSQFRPYVKIGDSCDIRVNNVTVDGKDNLETMSKFVQQIRTYNTFDSKYVVKRYNTWLENNKLFMQMECCSHCLRENSASLSKQDINNIGIIGKCLFASLKEKKQEFSLKLLMRIQKSWKRVLCDVGVNIDTINDLFNRMTSETPANRTTTELMQEFNRISRNSIQIDATMIASKDSFDRFGGDLCEVLLSCLSLEDRFRCECLSKQCQR